jgi:hypothetical protein
MAVSWLLILASKELKMAFVIESGIVVSFAEFDDVIERDQRLIDANEGLSDDVIDPLLVRATERILNKLRSSAWWRNYYVTRDTSINYQSVADVPVVNPNLIRSRLPDFTDLCVYTALGEFILPRVANFGQNDNEERQKMGYYTQKADALLNELITAGDWYDFDNSGTISSNEKSPGQVNLRRIR